MISNIKLVMFPSGDKNYISAQLGNKLFIVWQLLSDEKAT